MNEVVPFEQRNLLNRFISGAITASAYIAGLDQLVQRGEQLAGIVQQYYDRAQQTSNQLEQSRNSIINTGQNVLNYVGRGIYNAAERFSTPDQGYVDLVRNQHPGNLQITPNIAGQREVSISANGRQIAAPENPRDTQVRRTLDMQDATSSQSNSQRGANMEVVESTYAPTALFGPSNRTGGPGPTTDIANQPITYPFHDTTTGLLRYTGHFSVNALTSISSDATTLVVLMNTYKEAFAENSLVTQTAGEAPTEGISIHQSGRYLIYPTVETNYNDTLRLFTRNFAPDVAAPSMANYYDTLYSAYTVLSCSWTAIIDCPTPTVTPTCLGNTAGNRISGRGRTLETSDTPPNHDLQIVNFGRPKNKIYWWYSTDGDSISSDDQLIRSNIFELEQWPGIVGSKTVYGGETITISGTWFPGKNKHNPLNDADVERWTATGSAPANSYVEKLHIAFKQDWNDVSKFTTGLNVNMTTTWKVQFKSLNREVLWPTGNYGTDLILTFPEDITQYGPEL